MFLMSEYISFFLAKQIIHNEYSVDGVFHEYK